MWESVLIVLAIVGFGWAFVSKLRGDAEFAMSQHLKAALKHSIDQLDVDSAAHLYSSHILTLEKRAAEDTIHQNTADTSYRVEVVAQAIESLGERAATTSGKPLSIFDRVRFHEPQKIWSVILDAENAAQRGRGGSHPLRDRLPQFPYDRQRINMAAIQEFDRWSRDYFMQHQSPNDLKFFEKQNAWHAKHNAK